MRLKTKHLYDMKKDLVINNKKKKLIFFHHQGLIEKTDVEITVDHLTRLVLEEDDAQVR